MASRWGQAVLVVVISLLIGACSTMPESPPVDPAALRGQPPDGAYYGDGRLVLHYRTGGENMFLAAQWPVDALDPGRQNYRTTLMNVYEGPALDPKELQDNCERVALLERSHWNRIVQALLSELAPVSEHEAVMVTVQDSDIVFHRDASGRLIVHTLEGKPAALRVTRRINAEAFATLAEARLREDLHEAGLHGPVLFPAGEGDEGSAFVFFDLKRRQSVFIAREVSPLRADSQLGFSLRMVDALLLRSHLLGVLKNPLTAAHRLVWSTTQTGVALIPWGMGAPAGPAAPVAEREGMDLAAWEAELDRLVASKRYRGSMQPLIDGEAFFVSFIQAIQEAKESILIRLYIFDRDDYALKIADLLKRRSKEVKVKILLDQLGSLAAGQVAPASPYASRREAPGSIVDYLRQDSDIEIRAVDNPWLTSDHTKVVIVDGKKAYVGGMNIGHEYRYEWHDMMVEVEGPIVGRLHKDFEMRWAHTGLGGDVAYFLAAAREERYSGEAERGDYISLRPLYTLTWDLQILRAQLAAIHNARRYIYIEQAYISSDLIIQALIQARRRGVDVRVVLPGHSDSGFMNSANRLAANAFLENGIRVYIYPGMTHVKAAIYDGWACVGSANFDKLSLRINLETDLATSDPRFVDRLRRELFDRDFAKSRELTETHPVGWGDYIAEFIADQL